jgi:hypothetical protein
MCNESQHSLLFDNSVCSHTAPQSPGQVKHDSETPHFPSPQTCRRPLYTAIHWALPNDVASTKPFNPARQGASDEYGCVRA